MNAMHYTDYHMGVFLKWLEERSIFDDTGLGITRDHTVFHNLDFENLQKWANNKPLSVASEPNYCPLIMLSPDIQTNITVDEICYQMDIFPTILSAVGLEDYSWHGFGHNLLDSSSFCGQNESFSKPTQAECLPTFSVPEAFSLSDLIIRTNAFAK
jgi:phosphoglycerol transferase MdoB-like AlkP superfamily enzyme